MTEIVCSLEPLVPRQVRTNAQKTRLRVLIHPQVIRVVGREWNLALRRRALDAQQREGHDGDGDDCPPAPLVYEHERHRETIRH